MTSPGEKNPVQGNAWGDAKGKDLEPASQEEDWQAHAKFQTITCPGAWEGVTIASEGQGRSCVEMMM